jgi:hypothetical protein
MKKHTFKVGDTVKAIAYDRWSEGTMKVIEIGGACLICMHPTMGRGGFSPQDLEKVNSDEILVPMDRAEAIKMLGQMVGDLPHPFAFNIEHKQWDSMIENINALGEKLDKAKRLVEAIKN